MSVLTRILYIDFFITACNRITTINHYNFMSKNKNVSAKIKRKIFCCFEIQKYSTNQAGIILDLSSVNKKKVITSNRIRNGSTEV